MWSVIRMNDKLQQQNIVNAMNNLFSTWSADEQLKNKENVSVERMINWGRNAMEEIDNYFGISAT